MRFAGTWKQYSARAISQLTRMAVIRGVFLYFRWPYHARVMNVLDTIKSKIVSIQSSFEFGIDHGEGRREQVQQRPRGAHRGVTFYPPQSSPQHKSHRTWRCCDRFLKRVRHSESV